MNIADDSAHSSGILSLYP